MPLNRPEVMIANARDRFDADGNLIHEKTGEFVAQWLQNRVHWTRRFKGQRIG